MFSILIKIFLIGLLLHFFLFNVITYGIGIELTIPWLWKEIFIIFFLLLLLFGIFYKKDLKSLYKDKNIFGLEIVFVILVVISFLINFFLKDVTLGKFVMAFKYDFMAFMIFFLFYNLYIYYDKFFSERFVKKMLYFYGKVIKVSLIVAIFWWLILWVKPGTIDIFGYDPDIHEGKVGEKPPATYLTKQNHGIVRNQFLFERPINYGFWLTAFFPLFYVLYLRRKSLKRTWFWWIVYFGNIILTFSRAAMGAWIFEVIVLGLIDYRKNMKKYFKQIILPILAVIGATIIVGYNHIVMRYFSNSGHIELFQKGLSMFTESPILGKGAGYVGPASHWQGIAFNPENQFLQILIEFGIVLFLLWFAIYVFMSLYGFYKYWKADKKEKKNNFWLWILIAFSMGMIGLAIEGMVLHSFVDRMIIYPFMLLFGLVVGYYIKDYKNKKS